MPQNVPPFEWSDDALRLRQLVYEFWCEHGVGPNLRDVHEALGLSRRRIVQAYKQLQLGVICVVDEDSQNRNLLKRAVLTRAGAAVREGDRVEPHARLPLAAHADEPRDHRAVREGARCRHLQLGSLSR